VNFGPSASLSVPLDAYAGDSIAFDASGSSDPNIVNGSNIALTFNDSLSYTFYFDSLDLGNSETTNQSSLAHTYGNPGNYTVYVVVNDSFGLSSMSIQYLINVLPAPKSSGGGGGSGSKCATEWACTEWSSCSSDGIQARTCTKAVARCSITEIKPDEKAFCTPESEDEDKQQETSEDITQTIGSAITGAITGTFGSSRMRIAIAVIFAIITAGGILWFLRRKVPKMLKRKHKR